MSKFGKLGKLPRRPSSLIYLALRDMEKVERSRKFTINMDSWYAPIENSKCSVCFAGGVMAYSLGATKLKAQHLLPETFYCESPALRALDSFRQGAIDEALKTLGLAGASEYNVVSHFHVPWFRSSDYGDDDGIKPFKKAMKKMANYLRKAGL